MELLKKTSILTVGILFLTNVASAAKLPLEKTLSAGREIKMPVTKGRMIQVVAKNMIDGKSSWQGISYKEGEVIGDPTMTTYNFSSQGQGMTTKFSRSIRDADELVIKVIKGKVAFKLEEITPPPPDIKVEKFELKDMSGRGLLAKSDKELAIKITGDSKDKAAKGSFVLYSGEKPYQGEFKRIEYALNHGKTRSWKFPDKNKINSIKINNMSGKVQVRIEQPKFDIPKAKVKKTTEEMIYQLNSAIYGGAFDAAKQMLAMGVDINGQDMAGNTPLFMACMNGDPEFAKFLLGLGADPNIKNTRNSTPLMYAASRGNAEMVKLLLENGANVNVQSKEGETALSLAEEEGHQAVIKLLKSSGAK
jgi:hypothetical protein